MKGLVSYSKSTHTHSHTNARGYDRQVLERLKSEAGLKLFEEYMKHLTTGTVFKPLAKCYGCGSLRSPKDIVGFSVNKKSKESKKNAMQRALYNADMMTL